MFEEPVIRGIYNLAKEQGWLDKLLTLMKKKHKILVLDSSGVGKTNLLMSLKTLTPKVLKPNSDRTRAATKSRLKVDDVPFDFIDTPGQESEGDKEIRTKTILEYYGSLSAVINVVCYGYHEYAWGKKHAFNSDGSLNLQYLEDNRAREIRALN